MNQLDESANTPATRADPSALVADELPPEQIAVLRKAFDSFDREKSGSIPTDMVADILRLMGQPFNKKILDELIDEVDADKSGRLEFDEFVTLAAKFIVEEDAEALEKELREAFRLYDKEGNGYIPTTCLREILRELDDQLTNEELDMMIEEIDSDGSGTVDFDDGQTNNVGHFHNRIQRNNTV
ncbi:Troponin C, isoform 3 [Harpegnathos saltator]|uniref:Troponin C, isoform 3 n=1 Tax=Harpegnathos saltator TaxID=610380 RepID=E2C4F6_HARSA|nr:Troponin C, isoform 3 [Harpegnathos saltator]